jgi:hypothetical protein
MFLISPELLVLSPHDISMFSPSWKNHLKISHETYIPNIPIPSGKRLQKTMENHHAIKNGKSTISMGHSFNSFFYVYQRVRSPYLVSPSPSLDHEPGTVNPAAPSGPSAQRQSQAQATPCRRRGHGAPEGAAWRLAPEMVIQWKI